MLLPAIAMGQVTDYGIKMGAQSTGVSSDLSGDERLFGISAYGFADWQLNESFFTTIDFGFTQRGFKNVQYEVNETGEVIQKVEAVSRINYLSLASTLNIGIPIKSQAFYFGLGPRLDLLIHRNPGEFRFTNATFPDETVNEFDDYVFGISFVTGLKNISLKGLRLRAEVKYEMDITDSFSTHPGEIRNNVIMAVLGISL